MYIENHIIHKENSIKRHTGMLCITANNLLSYQKSTVDFICFRAAIIASDILNIKFNNFSESKSDSLFRDICKFFNVPFISSFDSKALCSFIARYDVLRMQIKEPILIHNDEYHLDRSLLLQQLGNTFLHIHFDFIEKSC